MTAGPTSGPTIRHVLFDADDVIQTIPGGWYAAMEPYVGDRAQEFLHGTWKELGRGHETLLALLTGHGVIAQPGKPVR